MSVTGYMYNINATKKLGEVEIQAGLEGNRSWHHQFRHSAYIYIGGLHKKLTEGDIIIVFSQFGEIVDVNLVRDKQTGQSKGFAFVCYEDQRSTILAVDNMNGYQLVNMTLRVDHVDKYKAPKLLDDDEKDEDGDPKLLEYKATGAEGAGRGVYNVLPSQQRIADVQQQKRSRPTGQAPPEDEDEAWARAFEEGLKNLGSAGGGGAKKKKKKKKKKDKRRKELEELKKMKKEIKKLKKETKKAKEVLKAQKGKEQVADQAGHRKRKPAGPESSQEASDSSEGSSEESSDDSEDSERGEKPKDTESGKGKTKPKEARR
uniref:RRM domain-containing protein n=1 Tax=Alexandrium monilatum TaxID=311494 RepID=A0A7S4R6P8_9DINO|mmetsp:Transcript_83951/g.259617  ORF Transcript_83951/g.259617 Transcript_83951/m.259617 type:complete len:317 (-) Transcript_83951:201-1151(-)